MKDPAPPAENARPGHRWTVDRFYEIVEERHVVTAAEVRHAIVYGGRMKTAGQVIVFRHAVSRARWVQVPL